MNGDLNIPEIGNASDKGPVVDIGNFFEEHPEITLPDGFNAWSEDEKIKWVIDKTAEMTVNGSREGEIDTESIPSLTDRLLRSAKTAMETLIDYSPTNKIVVSEEVVKGEVVKQQKEVTDGSGLRDPSFSNLDNEEKILVYDTASEAIKLLRKNIDLIKWFENKKIVLVGDEGAKFDGDTLQIGRGVSTTDVLEIIKSEYELNKTQPEPVVVDKSPVPNDFEVNGKKVLEGKIISWKDPFVSGKENKGKVLEIGSDESFGPYVIVENEEGQKIRIRQSEVADVSDEEEIEEEFNQYQEYFNLPVEDLSSKKVLDVGSGHSYFTKYLREKLKNNKAYAVDLKRPNSLQNNPNWFVIADGKKLPFTDDSFDMVTAKNYLLQIDFYENVEALGELLRVLKPGGTLYFDTLTPEQIRDNATNIQKVVGETSEASPQLTEMRALTSDLQKNYIDALIAESFVVDREERGDRIIYKLKKPENINEPKQEQPQLVSENLGDQEDEKVFLEDMIDPKLREELKESEINIEIVEGALNICVYDEEEKKIKIRQDAVSNIEGVNDYIRTILEQNKNSETERAIGGEQQEQQPTNEQGENVVRVEEFISGPECRGLMKELESKRVEIASCRVSKYYCLRYHEKEAKENEKDRDFIKRIREQKENEYYESQKPIEEKIKEYVRKIGETNGWSPEKIKAEQNDAVMTFVEMEGKEYSRTEKLADMTINEETVVQKTLGEAKKILNTKVVQGYLNLSTNQRRAVNFVLGGAVGMGVAFSMPGASIGAMGVASYWAWRAVRFGVSGFAGAKVGEWANKKWSAEELEQARQNALEELKNSGLSIKEKSIGFRNIEAEYKKAKRLMMLKKIGAVTVAGAGTGVLTGMVEHLATSVGGTIRAAIEHSGGKSGTAEAMQSKSGSGISDNRLSRKGFSRKGFSPSQESKPPVSDTVQNPKIAQEPNKGSAITEENPKIKTSESSVTDQNPKANAHEAGGAKTPEDHHVDDQKIASENKPETPEPTETADSLMHSHEIFSDPMVWIRKPEAGSSLWTTLDKTLEHNDSFAVLNDIQKQNVISFYVNKALENPGKFGFQPDPNFGIKIEAGKEIDFSKLIRDPEEFHKIISRAASLSSAQQADIQASDTAIANWVSNPENANVRLTPGKVSEILANKPKVSVVPEQQSQIFGVKPIDPTIDDGMGGGHSSVLESDQNVGAKPLGSAMQEMAERGKIHHEIPEKPHYSIDEHRPIYKREEIIPDKTGSVQSTEAVGGLAENSGHTGENVWHKFGEHNQTNTDNSFGLPPEKLAILNTNFRSDLDKLFGVKNWFGNFKMSGIDSPEWINLKGIKANDLLNYWKNPEAPTKISPAIIEQFSKSGSSEKYRNFVEYLTHLIDNANNSGGSGVSTLDIKPYDNGETVETFLKRVGSILIKQQK